MNANVEPDLATLIALRHQTQGISVNDLRRASSAHNGGHRAKVRGRGMDFAEVRVYQAGDEIRHMDWRVTARTDKPHIKLYQEERERPVFILVDMRPSMYFGTRRSFKSVVAAKAAAMIAWATVDHGDRIGGIVYANDAKQVELAPRARRQGALHLLKSMVDLSPTEPATSEQTSLVPALKALARISRPGSLVFILSDFYHFDAQTSKHIQRLVPHREVISGFIYDPLEVEVPSDGVFQFTDGEQLLTCRGEKAEMRIAYHKQFEQKRAALKALHYRYGLGWFELATSESVIDALCKGLKPRQGVTN